MSLHSLDTSLPPSLHVTPQALCLLPAARTLAALCDGTVTLVSTDTLEGVAFAAARGATHLVKVSVLACSLRRAIATRLTHACAYRLRVHVSRTSDQARGAHAWRWLSSAESCSASWRLQPPAPHLGRRPSSPGS